MVQRHLQALSVLGKQPVHSWIYGHAKDSLKMTNSIPDEFGFVALSPNG
jgi:hypothetical protein